MVDTTMQANPDTLVALYLHRSDGFETDWGDWRKSVFYHYGYIPYTVIDAFLVSSTGMFQTHIDQRLAVSTDVTLSLGATEIDPTSVLVTAEICVEPTGVTTTMKAHLFNILDYLPTTAVWYRNCVREGFQLGTVTVAPGTCVGLQQAIVFDATSLARPDDIKIAAFVEAPVEVTPGEVYQAEIVAWPIPASGHMVFRNGLEDGTLGGWSAVQN
ncbi:MAG: hypothetical protein MUC56_18895 [Thermoanaerobaculales bacterium]|nr:hypothetical protein [Thermoanaerobaculales bacterium]